MANGMDRFADQLQKAMGMASSALCAKNRALDLLSAEVLSLRRENETLLQAFQREGAAQVPELLASLQRSEQYVEELFARLRQEEEQRLALERELEDTAAAAQELWETMAADIRHRSAAPSESCGRTVSRPNSVLGGEPLPGDEVQQQHQQQQQWAERRQRQQPEEEEEEDEEAWGTPSGTPSGATTPRSTSSGSHHARPTQQPGAAGVLSAAAVAAAAAAGAGEPCAAASGAMHGILTPLENRLQSLTNKLMSLVSRSESSQQEPSAADSPLAASPIAPIDASLWPQASPASPRLAAGSSCSSNSTAAAGGGLGCTSVPRLVLPSGRESAEGAPVAASSARSGCGSSSTPGGDSSGLLAAAQVVAAAADDARCSGPDAAAVDGVAQLRLSPRGCGSHQPALSACEARPAANAAGAASSKAGADAGVGDQLGADLFAAGFLMGDVAGVKDA